MQMSAADITRAIQAFTGARGDPPPPLMKRRQRDALWTSWAGRVFRYLRDEFVLLQEAGQRLLDERDEAVAELRQKRTKESAAEIDAEIKAVEKEYHAESKKLDQQVIDIPQIEPYKGLMRNIELSPEERANLGPLLPDVLKGVDDVDEAELETDVAA